MGRIITLLKSDLSVVNKWKLRNMSYADNVVYGGLMGTIGALLSASGMFGGIGFLISALSTFPVLLASLMSLRTGFLTYLVTFFVLCVIQPSEAYVYLFTTGILGMVMGASFRIFKREIIIVLSSAIALLLGIIFLLLVIQFPVLGPSIGTSMDFRIVGYILLFTIVYSWVWVRGILLVLNKYSVIAEKFFAQKK